ncbi:hypothetical protein DFQ27_002951 [Actinomortierella ambigua]|uniref:Uncharacterized protein n=1 Tax=Actinomortierella ambigua TaxID=1343610 RepID=A0A9P6U5I0_9FUNG|nr:hypothetical protein DFQ27_002951 [Actinomortierella ambigua]
MAAESMVMLAGVDIALETSTSDQTATTINHAETTLQDDSVRQEATVTTSLKSPASSGSSDLTFLTSTASSGLATVLQAQPPPPKPKKKRRPRRRDRATDVVLDVLTLLRENNLSLAAFLKELFKSTHPKITPVTCKFYPYGAPVELLDIWRDEMRSHRNHYRDFVNSSIDLVIDEIRNELARVRRAGTYRFSAKSPTGGRIENHLDGRFLDSYAADAKYLMRLLKGLTGETKTASRPKLKKEVVDDESDGDDDESDDDESDGDGNEVDMAVSTPQTPKPEGEAGDALGTPGTPIVKNEVDTAAVGTPGTSNEQPLDPAAAAPGTPGAHNVGTEADTAAVSTPRFTNGQSLDAAAVAAGTPTSPNVESEADTASVGTPKTPNDKLADASAADTHGIPQIESETRADVATPRTSDSNGNADLVMHVEDIAVDHDPIDCKSGKSEDGVCAVVSTPSTYFDSKIAPDPITSITDGEGGAAGKDHGCSRARINPRATGSDRVQKVNKVTARRQRQTRACIAAILVYRTSQRCNAFQSMMGYFLRSTGTPKRVINVLSALGISVCHQSTRYGVRNFIQDARRRAEERAAVPQ